VTKDGAETLTGKKLVSPEIDQIVDANGDEIAIFTSSATPVNEVTQSSADTGNDPTYTASGDDADIGFDFITKGAGVFKVNGKGVAPEIFNTPILKVTNTGTVDVAKTPVSIAADVPAGTAVKAIIRVNTELLADTALVGEMECLIGEPSEIFATETHRATYAYGFNSSTARAADTNTIIVNLDGSQQFSYQLIAADLFSHTTTIYLLGYYL